MMKTEKATKAAKKEPKNRKHPTNKDAQTTKAARKESKGAKQPKEARAGSKKEIVLKLLRREQGATLAEIAKTTDWQNHSIRGFLSGQVTKKMGLTLESRKDDKAERSYRITS